MTEIERAIERMKIVIDIPQGLKIDFENENWTALTCAEMKNALKKGTILPKGHGDLIDRNEVIKSLFDYHNGKKTIGQCIDDVPAIIEAEKTTINHEKTTITDGDLISRNNAIELVNYALAENKDVLEVLENMPSAEK